MSILSVFREPAKAQRPLRCTSTIVFPPSVIIYAVWISTRPRYAQGAGIVGIVASSLSFFLALYVFNAGWHASTMAADGAIALPISPEQRPRSFHSKESDEASTPVAGPSSGAPNRSLRSSSLEAVGTLTRGLKSGKLHVVTLIDAALFSMNLGAVIAVDISLGDWYADRIVLGSYVSMFLLLNTLIHFVSLVLGIVPALYTLFKSFTPIFGKRAPKPRVLCSNCRAVVDNPTTVNVEHAATGTQISGTLFRDEETMDADAEQLLIGADGEVSSFGSNGFRERVEEPATGEMLREGRSGRDDESA